MELEDAEYDALSSRQLQGSAGCSIRNGSEGAIGRGSRGDTKATEAAWASILYSTIFVMVVDFSSPS